MKHPTCHNRSGTSCFHPKVDLGPIGTPISFRSHIRTWAISIQDPWRGVHGHNPPGQGWAHIKGIEEPDKTEDTQTDRYIDKHLPNVSFLLLLLAWGSWCFFLLSWVWYTITCCNPLPSPTHLSFDLSKLVWGQQSFNCTCKSPEVKRFWRQHTDCSMRSSLSYNNALTGI